MHSVQSVHHSSDGTVCACAAQVDAYVYAPAVVTAMAHGFSVACVVSRVRAELAALRGACDALGTLCVLRINPAVQHTQLLDRRLWKGAASGALTRRRMAAVADGLRRAGAALDFPILDSYAMTDAAWYASWDGLHYSFSARGADRAEASPFAWQWQGGVSHMSTVALLNMLCNRCGRSDSGGGRRRRRRSGGGNSSGSSSTRLPPRLVDWRLVRLCICRLW